MQNARIATPQQAPSARTWTVRASVRKLEGLNTLLRRCAGASLRKSTQPPKPGRLFGCTGRRIEYAGMFPKHASGTSAAVAGAVSIAADHRIANNECACMGIRCDVLLCSRVRSGGARGSAVPAHCAPRSTARFPRRGTRRSLTTQRRQTVSRHQGSEYRAHRSCVANRLPLASGSRAQHS
jgi:hypothetical protein